MKKLILIIIYVIVIITGLLINRYGVFSDLKYEKIMGLILSMLGVISLIKVLIFKK